MFPLLDVLSNFEDTACWDDFTDSFETAIKDPTILLDKYWPPSDNCLALVNGIVILRHPMLDYNRDRRSCN